MIASNFPTSPLQYQPEPKEKKIKMELLCQMQQPRQVMGQMF